MLRKIILSRLASIFLLVCCCLSSAIGQTDLNFTSLTTKDGLSSNTVNAIHKDRDGLIWFGTSDGLNKFDGTSFTVYRHIANDSTSLPANEILCLYEDRSGRLWTGISGGGLTYYDRRHDVFTRYKGDGSWKYINTISAKSIAEDGDGNLWVATYNGLKKIDLKTNKITSVYLDPDHLYPDQTILHLFCDSHRRMWVGTSRGLYLYNAGRGTFRRFDHEESDQKSLSGGVIKQISEDRQGNIWIGTTNGLNLLLPDETSFRAFRHDDRLVAGLSDNIIYAITPYDQNHLWIGTEQGLDILDTRTLKFTTLMPNPRKVFSLTNHSVRCIFIDKEGISWVGTFQGGVNKHDKNMVLFNLVKSNPFDVHGLVSTIVTSFAEYTKNQVFVGTDGGGLHLFDKSTGLFTHFDLSGNRTSNLSVLALEMDSKGKLWVGTYQKGLFWFDPKSGRSRQFLAGNKPEDINQSDIFCIKEDSKGNVWVGTNGQGVNIYDPNSHVFHKLIRNPTGPGDLHLPLNGFMRCVSEDAAGDMWLGSAGTGLAVYHTKNRTFTVYNRANSGLGEDGVLTILHDSHQITWVGTNGGGLCKFDNRSRQFKTYSEKDGLANNIVYNILEDKTGLLWLSTDNGISSFNPATSQFRNFSKYNGLQNGPFTRGAGLRQSDGELFFGGQDGFNFFEPSNFPTNLNIPTVLLTELKVANTTVTAGDDSPLKEQIGIADNIRLDYGQNFSISYEALNYTTPQQNRYSYKLDGFDQNWNDVGRARTASYTNVGPGTYVFQVRACNAEGLWSSKVKMITIKILPPFWRTIYAYIFYFFAVFGSLFLIRRRGINKIRLEFSARQEKEAARQLLEQERRENEKLNELNLLKIKFLTNLSHEFRTPISLILAPADKLLAMQPDTVASGQVNMIRRNAKRLLNLVNQLLDFRKMEEHELKLNLSPGDLAEFVRDAADSFTDLSERKKIDLKIVSETESLPATFDHDKIERIVFNLLSNAFKFTHQGGIVTLTISDFKDAEGRQNFCLKVADTGIGIPADDQANIFNRFFQHDSPNSILNQGSGIGLSITREFVQMQGGEITVSSEPEKGSVFTVILPVVTVPEELLQGNKQDLENSDDADFSIGVVDSFAETVTVLLVEDNDDFRYYLKDNLKQYYHIVEASNGKEGWQKTLSSHPQLVVSDISMPYMNGIELNKKIKSDKRTNHIPVILLTAMPEEQDQITGLESGANDYLTKPFNFEILNAKIKNLLIFNQTLKTAYSKQIQVVGQDIEIESSDAKLLHTIVSYIGEKLKDPNLSVEDLSKHVGMSRGSLYHKLLELTGLSPIEYIRSVKLDRAAALLERSDYNVAQISYMTGFGTPSYFSRIFKAKYNLLPSEYMHVKRKSGKERLDLINYSSDQDKKEDH